MLISSKHHLDATTRQIVFGGSGTNVTLRRDVPRVSSGTTIRSNRLFWNVPVRQQIARQQGGDLELAKTTMLRAALAYPTVSFSLTDMDSAKVLFSCTKQDSFEGRMAQALGRGSASINMYSTKTIKASPMSSPVFLLRKIFFIFFFYRSVFVCICCMVSFLRFVSSFCK